MRLLITILVLYSHRVSSSQSSADYKIEFSKEYFGVSYSPFAKGYEIVDGKEQYPPTLNYTYEYVLAQVKLLVENNVAFAVTFGMGASDADLDKDWHEGFPISASIARAAAEVNKNCSSTIKIIQGIYQISNRKLMDLEIKFAIRGALEANQIYPGTVTGFSLFDWAEDDEEKIGELQETIAEIRKTEGVRDLLIGTRSYTCRNVELNSSSSERINLLRVVGLVDFVTCGNFPNKEEVFMEPEVAVHFTGERFLRWRDAIHKVHPQVQVINGESGWPSKGVSYNGGNSSSNTVNNTIRYWKAMNDWARRHEIPVMLFQPFDEPLKASPLNLNPTDPSGRWGAEGHYGFWKLQQNNDPYSLIPKYEGPSEFQPLLLPDGSVSDPISNGDAVQQNIIVGSVVGLLVVVISGLLIYVVVRRQKKSSAGNFLSKSEVNKILYSHTHVTEDESWMKVPYNCAKFEKPFEYFILDESKLLGSGNFGSVFQGTLTHYDNAVAIKTIRINATNKAIAARCLLQEAKILSYIGTHANVVEMIAASTNLASEGKVLIALSICENGNLEEYLRTNENLKEQLSRANGRMSGMKYIWNWAEQIGRGMEHLTIKNVIHGDLAARNILLTKDLTAKITDFGLSKRLYLYTEYIRTDKSQELPWRWMAPEVLRTLAFSLQSDVWSYGIVLWELFSFGNVPYSGLDWNVDFVSELDGGLRLHKPQLANDKIFYLMQQCWGQDPNTRPSFTEILPVVERLVAEENTAEQSDILQIQRTYDYTINTFLE